MIKIIINFKMFYIINIKKGKYLFYEILVCIRATLNVIFQTQHKNKNVYSLY